MQPHPLERGILHVEEVQENERFQHLTKVAWAHQPRDRTVAVPSGPADDLPRLRLSRRGRCRRMRFNHVELPSSSPCAWRTLRAEELHQLRTSSEHNQGG